MSREICIVVAEYGHKNKGKGAKASPERRDPYSSRWAKTWLYAKM